jgi:hypothetical protein
MRRAHIAVNHENIFLAKTKDSESTTRASSAFSELPLLRARVDRSKCDSQKRLQHRGFLHSWLSPTQGSRGFFAFAGARCTLSSNEAQHLLSRPHVNTSLSATLLFSMRWCIRNEVHFDSRMHAATKLSQIGGQYGQESKEEGEERSEEDCEEDPQGLQEEVSLA